jgi:hypothetical protein
VSNGGGGGLKIIQPSRIAIMPEYDNYENSFDVNDNEKFKTISHRDETIGLSTEFNNKNMNSN